MPTSFDSLLYNNDVIARMNIHMRLLYSETDAKRAQLALERRDIPSENWEMLAAVNFIRLAVERQSRIGQLVLHLGKQCGPLWSCISQSHIFELVSDFANSEEFWQVRGRTLAENFCMYVHSKFKEKENSFLGNLAELLGTMSALMANSEAKSPWTGHRQPSFSVGREIQSEAFLSDFDLLDCNGKILTDIPNYPKRPNAFETSIFRMSDGSCLLGSIDLMEIG